MTPTQQEVWYFIYQYKELMWMVVIARGLEYGGREFKPRSLHLKPVTKLREERELSGCRKGLKAVPLAQALLSLKPAKTSNNKELICESWKYIKKSSGQYDFDAISHSFLMYGSLVADYSAYIAF